MLAGALVDTHCHIGAAAYEADRADVLSRAWAAGLGAIVAIGEAPETLAACLEAAAADPRISVAAGVHPHDAATWSPEREATLAALMPDPRVVALGEIGLDYHYEHAPRDRQQEAFEAQLALARRTGHPVVIHAREADDDVAATLRRYPDVPAVLHSFSSGPALLRAALDLGHYVSFSGMVTFRNWGRDDAVLAVPADRLLVETDGPYLAPVPHRGKRNEPALVRHVAERIAQVRGASVGDVVATTGANAARLFGPRLHR